MNGIDLAAVFALSAGMLTLWNVLRQVTKRQGPLEFLARQVMALVLAVVGITLAALR